LIVLQSYDFLLILKCLYIKKKFSTFEARVNRNKNEKDAVSSTTINLDLVYAYLPFEPAGSGPNVIFPEI